MTLVSVSDIPKRYTDPDRDEAFRQILCGLFEEYPVARVPGYPMHMRDPGECRAMALENRGDPARAAFMACDTGVPNELILGAYNLIYLEG